MSRVEQIEREIEQLSPAEFEQVARWVLELHHARWDAQLDRDATSGKLDFLVEEAQTEQQAGLLKDWP